MYATTHRLTSYLSSKPPTPPTPPQIFQILQPATGDVDAAFLKNPLPHIPMNYTMVVQHDSRLPGLTACGCFVVLHPTVKSELRWDV